MVPNRVNRLMLLITKLFTLWLCSVASSFIVELVFLHTGLRFYIFNVSRFYGSISKCYNNDKFVIFRGVNFLSSTKLKFSWFSIFSISRKHHFTVGFKRNVKDRFVKTKKT